MENLALNWEQVALVVIVCVFFVRLEMRIEALKTATENLQSAIETSSKESTKEHTELLSKTTEAFKEVHEHMRSDTKEHNAAHKELADKMTETLAMHRATGGPK